MFRSVFPPKDEKNPDPEKRIDCGDPSLLEDLSGKQQIAFPIKGYALLRFELRFRIFRKDLQQYIDEIGSDYPMVTFYVYENKVSMFVEVEDLCDTQPLTVKFTAASAVHDQTYRKVRDVMSIVDDVYDRILAMHMERYGTTQIDHREHLELPDGEAAQ